MSSKRRGSTESAKSRKDEALHNGWQTGKALTQCNAYMFKNKPFYDVKFHVGIERQTIKAHKYVLLSRSPVFFAMFSESTGNHHDNIYSATDIQPDIFNLFLKYLYCDETELTPQNVTPLLLVAKKYEVNGLVDLCTANLREAISEESVCAILEQAHSCADTLLQEHCLEFIFRHAHAALKSDGFQALCPACVRSVIEPDRLLSDEQQVYEAVVAWATKQCKRKQLSLTDASRAKVLGDLKFLVRFPLMTLGYFTRSVSTQSILDKDEKIALFQYFHTGAQTTVAGFNSQRRKVTRVMRFGGISGNWKVGNFLDAIQVSVSKPITVDGVLIYGCNAASSAYDVTVAILDDKNNELSKRNAIVLTESSQDTYDIVLHSPVQMEENVWYTVTLEMHGPQTKRGVRGQKTVTTDHVDFEFKDSKLAHNCSTEREGQIPGLVFHCQV